jgi:hypothetical protein
LVSPRRTIIARPDRPAARDDFPERRNAPINDLPKPSFPESAAGEQSPAAKIPRSFFMNKFRKLGFIDYNGDLEIHSALLNVVLHD